MTNICKGCGKEFVTHNAPSHRRKFCYCCNPIRHHGNYTAKLETAVLAAYEDWKRDFAAGKTVSNLG